MRSYFETFYRAVVLGLFLLAPIFVSAGALFVSPDTGSYEVGKIFSVKIRVSAPQSINAVAGNLIFPTDKLKVVSVSKIGSILTLWVQDPTFNNSTGQVSFEGVVPNPGFLGQGGLIATVNFLVLGAGSATIHFNNASVLANDGNGTNIISGVNSATYSLEPAKIVAPAEVEPEPEEVVIVEEVNPIQPQPIKQKWHDLWFIELISPLLVLLLIAYILSTKRQKVRTLKREKFKSDIRGVEKLVDKSFMLLKEDVEESVKLLEKTGSKRRLTAEEDAIMGRLRENLDEAEDIIQSKVREIEKEIE